MGEYAGSLAAGFSAKALGGASLGSWRLLDYRTKTRTRASRLHILCFSFDPCSATSAHGDELLGCRPKVAKETMLYMESRQLELERMSLSFSFPCPHGIVPCLGFSFKYVLQLSEL